MIHSLCVIVLSTVGQVTPTGPLCTAPPRNADEACVTCYQSACVHWITDFYACDGNRQCIDNATRMYRLMLMNCFCRPALAVVLDTVNQSQSSDALAVLGSTFSGERDHQAFSLHD